MRLIDAYTFRREIDKYVDEYGHINMTITQLMTAVEHSEVDAVPVIRCKDCKFFIMADNKYHEDDFEPYPACALFYDNWGEMPIEVSENDFCSRAERREE